MGTKVEEPKAALAGLAPTWLDVAWLAAKPVLTHPATLALGALLVIRAASNRKR